MKITRSVLSALLFLAGVGWQALAVAQQAGAAAPKLPSLDEYTQKGADTCLSCHDDESPGYSAAAIFSSKHGQPADKRSPFGAGGLQCEACHGPGAQHSAKGSKKKLSINSFKADSYLPVAQRNQACLSCHEGTSRTGWHAGTHERNNLACTDCHKIHQPQGDPMLAKATEAEACLSCHKDQRADFHKPSTHPVRYGLMSCSGCHSPHGSTADAMLVKPTLNQTCYSCHAEKRGPLLWEHQPVTEDCSLCHSPHGSLREAMLNKSPALLCQQCHSPAAHPSVARTSNGLPGGSAGGSIFVVAGSCLSCHSQVHGSNHPSGAKLMR